MPWGPDRASSSISVGTCSAFRGFSLQSCMQEGKLGDIRFVGLRISGLGLGIRVQGFLGDYTGRLENEMEKNMEKETESGMIRGSYLTFSSADLQSQVT